MADWLTYTLSDFLPFSRPTYLRLFEIYNARFWPAVVLGLALGLWMLWSLRRPTATRVRLSSALLGACWLWIAWAFLSKSYAPLIWAANYAAVAFAVQGSLLLAAGIARLRRGSPEGSAPTPRFAYGMLVLAVLLMPILGFLLHRPWTGLELFGTAPDPTVLATLGLLALIAPHRRHLLMIVPAAWSLISGLTLLALGDPLWPLLPTAVIASITASFWQPGERTRRSQMER